MMESTYNLRLVSYVMYGAIIHILLVASVQTTSVHLGPVRGFRDVSDVIFPGEKFILQCVWNGLTTCNISMLINDTVIYEEGGLKSNDYDFHKIESSSSLNIIVFNITIQHKGIYKCRIQNGDTTMEDTYNLNVVTKSPQCLAKFNESDKSFQLFCYTFSPIGQSAFQTWEIIEPGNNSKTFTNFSIQQRSSTLVVKIVGVSHAKITKENLTNEYKCSYSNDLSRNCYFNFESSIDIDGSTPTIITSDLPTNQRHSMRPLRNTSTSISPTSVKTSEQPVMKSIIIIVAVTVLFLLVTVCLTIMICKTKSRFSCKGRMVNETHTNGDLVQTGTVLSKLSDNVNPGISSCDEIQRKSERGSVNDKHNRNTMNREGRLPEDLYNTVEKRSVHYDVSQSTSHEIKENTNRSHKMNSEGKVPEDLYGKVKKRSVRHDVRQSTSHGIEENKHKSNTKNDEDEVPDDLYAKVKKRSTRYQANKLRDTQCEPYSIVDINTLTFQDANFQKDSSINTSAMVDCSVYELCEDKTEDEIHYDVLDPSKNETLA